MKQPVAPPPTVDVAAIRHDLANALTVLRLTVDLLVEDPDTDDLEVMLQELQAAVIAADFSLTKLSGRQDEPVLTDLGLAVTAGVRAASRKRGAKMRLDVVVATGSAYVLAHRGALVQVLYNLVMNAQEACGDRGTLTVRLDRDDAARVHRVIVADDGPGLSDDIQTNLFARGASTKSDPFGGRGHGLANAREYLESQGGRLLYTSTAAGEGATFVIELPSVPHERADASME